jgi:hypothetical protein
MRLNQKYECTVITEARERDKCVNGTLAEDRAGKIAGTFCDLNQFTCTLSLFPIYAVL